MVQRCQNPLRVPLTSRWGGIGHDLSLRASAIAPYFPHNITEFQTVVAPTAGWLDLPRLHRDRTVLVYCAAGVVQPFMRWVDQDGVSRHLYSPLSDECSSVLAIFPGTWYQIRYQAAYSQVILLASARCDRSIDADDVALGFPDGYHDSLSKVPEPEAA